MLKFLWNFLFITLVFIVFYLLHDKVVVVVKYEST